MMVKRFSPTGKIGARGRIEQQIGQRPYVEKRIVPTPRPVERLTREEKISVPVQARGSGRIRAIYDEINQELAKSGGFVRGSAGLRIKVRARNLGFSETEAEKFVNVYKKAVTKTGAFQKSRAFAIKREEIGAEQAPVEVEAKLAPEPAPFDFKKYAKEQQVPKKTPLDFKTYVKEYGTPVEKKPAGVMTAYSPQAYTSKEFVEGIGIGAATLVSTKKAKEYLKGKLGTIKRKDEVKTFKDIFTPFQYAGKTKYYETTPYLKTGTISPYETSFKTWGGIQKEIELTKAAEVMPVVTKYKQQVDTEFSKLQVKVDEGKLTMEAATQQLKEKVDKINIAYQKEYGEKAIKYKDIPKIYTRAGKRGIEDIGMGLELAAFATPQTTALLGTYKLGKGAKEDIIIAEDGRVPLYPSYKVSPTTKEASLIFGFAGLQSIGAFRKLERDIVTGEIKALEKAPVKLETYSIQEGKEALDVTVAMQKWEGLKTEAKIIGKVERKGKYGFITPEAKGEAMTIGKLDWSILGGARPTRVIAAQRFDVGVKGITLPLKKESKQFISLGKGQEFISLGKGGVRPTYSASAMFQIPKSQRWLEFPTGRIVPSKAARRESKRIAKQWLRGLEYGGKVEQDFFLGLGVKKKKDLYESLAGQFEFKPVGTKLDLRYWGKTRILTPSLKKDMLIKKAAIKQTPLSKTFAPQITRQVPRTPLTTTFITSPVTEKVVKKSTKKLINQITKQSSKQFAKIKATSSLLPAIKLGMKERAMVKQTGAMRSLSKQIEKIASIPKQQIRLKQPQKERVALVQRGRLKTLLEQLNELTKPFGVQKPRLKVKPPFTPKIPIGIGFIWLPKAKLPLEREKVQAYLPYGRQAKSKKWVRLSDKPMSQAQARGRMAEALDKTISAKGKIMKAKSKVVDSGSSYWATTQHKFREYVKRRGKQIKTPNQFIERRKFRIDTVGERGDLTLAKLIKQQGWIKPKKKIKRRKKSGKKKKT